MLGMFLGAILVHTFIDGIANLDFLSIPVPTATYNTTTIPVIFGVLFIALIDRLDDRFIPQAIKYFLKPLLVILITVDLENISAAGYDLTTPIIVTNTADHEPFAMTVQEDVNREETGTKLVSVSSSSSKNG